MIRIESNLKSNQMTSLSSLDISSPFPPLIQGAHVQELEKVHMFWNLTESNQFQFQKIWNEPY